MYVWEPLTFDMLPHYRPVGFKLQGKLMLTSGTSQEAWSWLTFGLQGQLASIILPRRVNLHDCLPPQRGLVTAQVVCQVQQTVPIGYRAYLDSPCRFFRNCHTCCGWSSPLKQTCRAATAPHDYTPYHHLLLVSQFADHGSQPVPVLSH